MDFAKKCVRKFEIKMEKQFNSKPAGTLGRFVFLDRTKHDLDDSVTVLGCTLFSQVTTEQARAVASRLVDLKDILHWDVSEHADAHLPDLAWLNEEVGRIAQRERERKIVIMSHHSPTTDNRATNPRYRSSEVSSGYVTDLSNEICWKPTAVQVWAFGHTHYNCDFTDGHGKRVVGNQRGYYMFPQSSFEPGKVIQIGGCDSTEDMRRPEAQVTPTPATNCSLSTQS